MRVHPSILIICLLCLPSLQAAAAPSRDEAVKRLEAVQTKIGKVQAEIQAARGKLGKLESQLRRTERDIGKTVKELRGLDRKLHALEERLTKLRGERADQLSELDHHRAALAGQVRSTYMAGHQPALKLWLSQDDPSALGRMLVYLEYLNRARTERIEAVEEALKDLRAIEAEIAEKRTALESTREEVEVRHASLVKQKREREDVSKSLRRELRAQGKTLESLRADEQELQSLVESLSKILADIPSSAGSDQPFASLRGRLGRPAGGPFKAKFGDSRGDGKLTWRGVLIGTPEGTPVRAVSHGRVAFAEWMRGFGLLIILDHGGGYMSLYGNNQGLYKTTGDWVEAGEVIATSGASGGVDEPGLYFEIRHKGKPVNPAGWFGPGMKLAGTSE